MLCEIEKVCCSMVEVVITRRKDFRADAGIAFRPGQCQLLCRSHDEKYVYLPCRLATFRSIIAGKEV